MQKAFRRSGVRLRSASTGHTELQLIISELGEMKVAHRKFRVTQKTATEDLLKWSLVQENRAVKDCALQVHELSMIWNDVQKGFSDQLKNYRHQFELVLEGEKQLDSLKQKLTAAEAKENKIRKELEKATRKSGGAEISEIESRLKEAVSARDLVQAEVLECHKENEAVKLIRMKQGLLKMSEGYLELAHKCVHIFEAQKEIASGLPDVQDSDLHSIRYTGAVSARNAVLKAKEKIEQYSDNVAQTRVMPSAPPPYNPFCYGADVASSVASCGSCHPPSYALAEPPNRYSIHQS